MRFLLLGRIEVHGPAGVATFTDTRQSALLVTLLLCAGHSMSTEELVSSVWGTGSRSDVVTEDVVRASVHRLRRTLAEVEKPAGERLSEDPAGYRLRVDAGECDVYAFTELAKRGRAARAAGDHERAVTEFTRAIEIWRGPALAGASGPFACRHAARLEDARLEVTSGKLAAELVLHHPGALAELRKLVAQHPTSERLHHQVMRALYQAGRPIDALAAFQVARRLLVDRTGVEPGPQLQELRRRILAGDTGLRALSAQPVARVPEPRRRSSMASGPSSRATHVVDPTTGVDRLAVVLGEARATVLRELDTPTSMGALAARLNVTAGSASRHCDALSRAGLVSRHRRGQSVLVLRTEIAVRLLDLLA